MEHEQRALEKNRFEFGANWSLFLRDLNEERVTLAIDSLKHSLNVEDLSGKKFLDIGSGSGLFSLAARRLGATVFSFDYDPQSVACTRHLKERFFPVDSNWNVEEGSALDASYMKKLGQFDVVYSWGVLHHTGAMWQGLENASSMVLDGGVLFISIYNDQGPKSNRWLLVKRAYNKLPRGWRWLVWFPALVKIWWPTVARDLLSCRPLFSWKNYPKMGIRGMSAFRDLIDWVGGLPFEVAKPEEIYDFYYKRGFTLERMKTCGGGLGCNEFVFSKK
jgi:SAM-dependent methyltransferase